MLRLSMEDFTIAMTEKKKAIIKRKQNKTKKTKQKKKMRKHSRQDLNL